MSVRSENFNNLIAIMVVDDKKGVVQFLRSQGVMVSADADAKDIVKAIYVGLRNKKFADAFAQWSMNRYDKSSNAMGMEKMAGGEFDPMATQSGGFSPMETQFANAGHMPMKNAGGEFDPMATQSGGFSPMETQFANAGHMPMNNASGEFDPMDTQSGGFSPISTQDGSNLKGERFANAGGEFDPMDTQSGGFSPISTQEGTNLKEERFANAKGHLPYDPVTKTGGSKIGNFLREINIGDTISSGLEIWQNKELADQQKDILNAQQKADQNQLDLLLAQGEISRQNYEQQLALLREGKKENQGNVILYVIGGIVLLAGIGTAIYFATRKKK